MDTYLALWAFIVAMVATPGPANMLLMTAGARQGYFQTLPFGASLESWRQNRSTLRLC